MMVTGPFLMEAGTLSPPGRATGQLMFVDMLVGLLVGWRKDGCPWGRPAKYALRISCRAIIAKHGASGSVWRRGRFRSPGATDPLRW